jgi:hypothetical protein
VAAILGHFGAHTRHFRDLMALRLRVVASEPASASRAGGGPEFDEVINFCGRQQPAGVTLMAGLAATLAPLRHASGAWLIRGRVR